MTPNVWRGMALVLLLISVTLTVLRLTGVTTWDLGPARPVILIVAVIFLLFARRRTVQQ